MVRLAPTRLADGDQVPTRTIGDPSTGTDPHMETQTSQTSEILASIGRPPSSKPTVTRPSYVELPKRPAFGLLPKPSPTESLTSNLDNAGLVGSSSTTRLDTQLDPPLRVLVVDDDPLTRKLMKRMLTRLGCTVSTAENGSIALGLITGGYLTPSSEFDSTPVATTPPAIVSPEVEEPRYELVFLDNQMPVLSGLDTVARLRSMGRMDFVVGVTGTFEFIDHLLPCIIVYVY